ncbi:MAG: hypothetical protein ACE3JK_14140 [Sporolactobacillus sp.]
MDDIRSGVIKNEWSKVIAIGCNLIGATFIIIGVIISFKATYQSYIYATENIAV